MHITPSSEHKERKTDTPDNGGRQQSLENSGLIGTRCGRPGTTTFTVPTQRHASRLSHEKFAGICGQYMTTAATWNPVRMHCYLTHWKNTWSNQPGSSKIEWQFMDQASKRAFVKRGHERPPASDPYNNIFVHGKAVPSMHCTVLYVMGVSAKGTV